MWVVTKKLLKIAGLQTGVMVAIAIGVDSINANSAQKFINSKAFIANCKNADISVDKETLVDIHSREPTSLFERMSKLLVSSNDTEKNKCIIFGNKTFHGIYKTFHGIYKTPVIQPTVGATPRLFTVNQVCPESNNLVNLAVHVVQEIVDKT